MRAERPATGPCRSSTMSRPTVTMERPAAPSPVERVTAFEVASARCRRRSSVGVVVPSCWAVPRAWRTWPAISSSPTTIDSRPEATENR